MGTKPKRHSMAEALKERKEVRAFLAEGRANLQSDNSDAPLKLSKKSREAR